MCNERLPDRDDNDLNLILYRLDKLETEQRKDNENIMNVLQAIQDGLTETNKTIVLHTAQITQLQEHIKNIEDSKLDSKEFNSEHDAVVTRLDTYKQILMAVAAGVGVSLLVEFFKII